MDGATRLRLWRAHTRDNQTRDTGRGTRWAGFLAICGHDADTKETARDSAPSASAGYSINHFCFMIIFGGRGRTRTGTPVSQKQILSLLCLPFHHAAAR
jgi:hypothetical protein